MEKRTHRSQERNLTWEERTRRWDERTQRSEARFYKRVEAIKKLMATAMKMIIRGEARQKQNDLRFAEVGKKLDALVTFVGSRKAPGSRPR